MPLVRIDVRKGKSVDFGKKVSEIVYQAMRDTLNVPAMDNFQIIAEHDKNGLIYDGQYLNVPRSDGIVMIQITLNAGRTVEMKKTFYQTVALRLDHDLGVRLEDVFISLVEVAKENWSFGNGIAQYA